MVALQAFAAQTRISLTTSALFSDSGLQPCSSTNRCFPSACNDLPPFVRVVGRYATSVMHCRSNALYLVFAKLQEKNEGSPSQARRPEARTSRVWMTLPRAMGPH